MNPPPDIRKEAADKPRRILLVEDNPVDSRLLEMMLSQGQSAHYELVPAARLDEALRHLRSAHFDVLISDLSLPDSQGLDTFRSLRAAAGHMPLLVLSGTDDESLAVSAVREGAQDYLVKGRVDAHGLRRAIRYAIERQRIEAALRKANEDLKSAQLQLIQAEKMESIGTLAAGVAHEVKNPLAIVLMGVNFLSKNLPDQDENVKLVLKEMREAVERADSIARGLLDFAGSQILCIAPADLNAVLDHTLRLVRHELAVHNVAVEREWDTELPPVGLDRNQIQHVFVNIFVNAIQAMPSGGTLTVRTSSKQLTEAAFLEGSRAADALRAGDHTAVVEIEDTGTGISKENLARIFDPFFTTKPTGVGTGLGLAVAKKIIELHRGTIDIRNLPQGGVRVSITLKTESPVA